MLGYARSHTRVATLTTPVPSVTSVPARGLAAAALLALVARLALLAVLARPAGAQAEAGNARAEGDGRPLVTAVKIGGVRNVELDELREGLATRATECRNLLYTPICFFTRSPTFANREYLDELEMRRDVVRIRFYYWLRGWRDAQVETAVEPKGEGVHVTFTVEEGEPTIVRSLDVAQTDTVLPPPAITRALQIRAGDPADFIALDSSAVLLKEALWERGHADAEVALDTAALPAAGASGPVQFVVTPGPVATVGDIDIEGNRLVSDETIRRLLHFRTGDVFRRGDAVHSVRDLYLSGLFSEVEMQAPPPGDSVKTVQLLVTEADLNRLDVSGGVSTSDFVQLDAQYVRLNFTGGARSLTLRTTLGNLLADQLSGRAIFHDVTDGLPDGDREIFLRPIWSASVEFTQPWLGSAHTRLGASVFTHRRSVPGVVVDRGDGVTLNVTRDFADRDNSTLGYTFQTSRVDAPDVYFCVTFGVCLPSTIRVLQARHSLATVSWVTQLDHTDDPLAPTRGFRARSDVEHGSAFTGSDFRFNRAEVEGSAYLRVFRRSTLAARVRLGYVDALRGTSEALGVPVEAGERIVHPRRRFYAGGSRSVRGYGENQLGPRVLTVSPEVLTDTALAAPCSTAELRDATCDPNRAASSMNAFQPQPLGGTSLAEGSVELRIPISRAAGLTGAIFVDGALIGTSQFRDLLGARGAITPGFGIRLQTPAGPVRLDLGIRPSLVERLPVVTQVEDANGMPQLVSLTNRLRYDPLERDGNLLRRTLSRLTLHLAIGPPY